MNNNRDMTCDGWFTGSIGFHHIHHLKPGIPNYTIHH